jgi:ribosomal protein S18 acetylase RimI-like enzyme
MSKPEESALEGITFHRYDAASARDIRDIVQDIYTGSYTKRIESGDPFSTIEAFMSRFDSYASRNDFDMVVAFAGDKPIGQTWGWPLDRRAGDAWWSGLIDKLQPDFTREDGKRTFALSEIMVRAEYTGKHLAHNLHDKLLFQRPERRATLLIRPENERAYTAYRNWGWRKVGRLQPKWPNAPTFDVLVLDLPR